MSVSSRTQQVQDLKTAVQDLYSLATSVRDAAECTDTSIVPVLQGNTVSCIPVKVIDPTLISDATIQAKQTQTLINAHALLTTKLADVKTKANAIGVAVV